MLEINDIHAYYGESHILHGVSLKVDKGSAVALLGRNGMGKTTTIRAIIGSNPPRQGSITYNNKVISKMQPYQIARLGIGLIPQGRHIFPSLSVRENLTMAARPGPWSLEKIYSFFPILKERQNLRGTLLSGGEQQMLCIARSLMTNPELLLMDEPSEGLAPIIVKEISKIIGQLKQSGFSILLVEQNLHMALAVADYVYILSKGTIAYQSKPAELAKNEEVKRTLLGVSKC